MALILPAVAIRARAVEIVRGIKPVFEPGQRFVPAPMTAPLAEQHGLSGIRRFHVITGPLAGVRGATLSDWNASMAVRVRETLEVQVRYEVGRDREGYGRLVDLLAHDQEALIYHLSPQVSDWGDDMPPKVEPTGNVRVDVLEDERGVWLLRLPFELIADLGEDL